MSGQITTKGLVSLQWALGAALVVALFCCAMIAVYPAIIASLNPTPAPTPTITPLPTVASTAVPIASPMPPVPTVAPPTPTPTNVPPTSIPTVPPVTSVPVITPTPQPPTAVISGPNRAQVNQSVTFDANGSQPGSHNITTYNWDFGDGTQSSGITVSHIYQVAGSYNVTLIVVDERGQSDSTRLGIQVTAP